jgi:hypothetical protein
VPATVGEPVRFTAKGLRWAFLGLVGLLLLALVCFSYSANPNVTALRNVVLYKAIKAIGGPRVRTGELPGAIAGSVRDAGGELVPGAVVLVSSPLGHTYAAETGPDGGYRIDGVPPGRYVPLAGKRGYDDGLNQACLAGLCYKHSVQVWTNAESAGIDLTLVPAELPDILINDSLVISPTQQISVEAPFPSSALRTRFSFSRAGLRVNDCYLYEPIEGEGALPTMLLVLPGPVRNWEMIPVPFAAEGFGVLACYPLRGADIDGDVADLLTTVEYLRQGRIPSRADPDRLALVAASFTSLHAYRLLGLTDQVDVALLLGGMADGFAFHHDLEMGTLHARPPFDQAHMALGFPDSSPEQYFKYSVAYHLEGLPPLCLLHGMDDELVPFSQSVQFAEELEQRGMPHEFYGYEGLSHYFVQTADDATTQQMFQDSLECLRRWLADN